MIGEAVASSLGGVSVRVEVQMLFLSRSRPKTRETDTGQCRARLLCSIEPVRVAWLQRVGFAADEHFEGIV